ncbi:Serine/threonine-protein kinase TIO [Bienertia sinuspersici]
MLRLCCLTNYSHYFLVIGCFQLSCYLGQKLQGFTKSAEVIFYATIFLTFLQLCDFGFARAMSTKTVVLHSVKVWLIFCRTTIVTPIFDHISLALGQAYGQRYELFVGQPPSNTTSVYSLIRHTIKKFVLLGINRIACLNYKSNLLIFSKLTQEEALPNLNQSLRILSNLVAVEAITHNFLDEIIFGLLEHTYALLCQKSLDAYYLIAKNPQFLKSLQFEFVFYQTLLIIKKLIGSSGLSFGSSYFTQWAGVVELYSQVVLLF